tara:strand:+ start:113 stop:370 length:258 start_codon:yes stop_codon:yes gene_type:complete
MAKRAGMIAALSRCRWEMVVAGSFVRYRKRIRLFYKVQMRSKISCKDECFIYLEQSMWVHDCYAGHALYRTTITGTDGIITTNHV